jgi:chromosome partitioning protein
LSTDGEAHEPAIGITLTAFKGGQAKSTTAISLAAMLARRGLPTLLVDTDAQCNSSGMFVRWDEVKFGLRSAIVDKVPLDQVVQHTRIPNLDVLPASFDLTVLEREMVVTANGFKKIEKVLRPVRSAYRFIIFDTAPGLSHMTIGSLAASRYFIIPIAPEVWASDGLRMFMTWIGEQRDDEASDAELLGLVATKVDSGTRISRSLLQQLQAGRLPAFKTWIPKRVGNEDAIRDRVVAGERAADPDISRAYDELTEEVLARIASFEAEEGRHRA